MAFARVTKEVYLLSADVQDYFVTRCFLILMCQRKRVGTIVLRKDPRRHVQITSNFHFLIATKQTGKIFHTTFNMHTPLLSSFKSYLLDHLCQFYIKCNLCATSVQFN